MEKMYAIDCRIRLRVKFVMYIDLIGTRRQRPNFGKGFQTCTGNTGQKGVGIPRHQINKSSRAQFVYRTLHNFICAEVGNLRCCLPFRRISAEESANRCPVQQQNQAAFPMDYIQLCLWKVQNQIL
jgi:hypothetical protein